MKHTSTDMILSNLIHDSQFSNIVLPALEEKFMTVGPTDTISKPHQFIFKIIKDQYEKTNTIPSLDALSVLISRDMNVLVDLELKDAVSDVFDKLKTHICEDDSLEFRISQAEEHCRTVQSQISLLESAELIDAIDRNETDRGRHEIIDIMGKVFEIDFNPDLGTELSDDVEGFWERLHDVNEVIPFGIKPLDDALAGGLKKRGLTIAVGCTNVGKTALMCDFTARFMSQGRNVLYITKEISEDEVKERVYANILDMSTSTMKDMEKTPKALFVKRVQSVLSTCGRVFVKHDDSNNFNSEDVRIIAQSLEKKNNLKFDIIIVDNLSNMSPITMKRRGNIRGDEMLVAVAKELKNLSSRLDTHIIAPEQTTLECEYVLHPQLSDIANAKGISRVVDNAITIGVNEEFIEAGMIMVTIRKTRSKNSRGSYFRLGFNYSKQKTHEIDEGSNVRTEKDEEVEETPKTCKLKPVRIASRESKNVSRQPLLSI